MQEDNMELAFKVCSEYHIEAEPLFVAWGLSLLKKRNFSAAKEKLKFIFSKEKMQFLFFYLGFTDCIKSIASSFSNIFSEFCTECNSGFRNVARGRVCSLSVSLNFQKTKFSACFPSRNIQRAI